MENDQANVGRLSADADKPQNLPLPRAFDGTPEGWPKWSARFLRYQTVLHLNKKADNEKVGAFLYRIGDVAADLLSTMNVDENTVKFDELLEKFQNHFG